MENLLCFVAFLRFAATNCVAFVLAPVPGCAGTGVCPAGTAYAARMVVSGYRVTTIAPGPGFSGPAGVFLNAFLIQLTNFSFL